ncbi:hypothetical protein [Desulfotomaculum sp. 1211_IL3151]|uniref:hypothetical protein n=1 Tax=Desulfotomaculum sp. 1211_IL3151 TaxID=3084055 RepID=UPI002FDA7602
MKADLDKYHKLCAQPVPKATLELSGFALEVIPYYIKRVQELEAKYQTLLDLQHGRNWDDDEAERKLRMLSEQYRELEHKNRLLNHALYVANDTNDYYTYHPSEENNLGTLASDRPVRISSTWLMELLEEAKEEGRKELQAEVDRLTALNAHTVDELNKTEANLESKRQDYRTLRAEAVYLRVALREAMAYLPGAIGTSDMGRCQKCGAMTTSGSIRYCKKCIWEVAKGALSTDAGKDLLERLRKLEAVAEAAKLVLTRADGLEHYFAELDNALAAMDGDSQ